MYKIKVGWHVVLQNLQLLLDQEEQGGGCFNYLWVVHLLCLFLEGRDLASVTYSCSGYVQTKYHCHVVYVGLPFQMVGKQELLQTSV